MLQYIAAFQNKTEKAFSLKRLRIKWQIWWPSDNCQTWNYENFVPNVYKIRPKNKGLKAHPQLSASKKLFRD